MTMKISTWMIAAVTLKDLKSRYPETAPDLDKAIKDGVPNKWLGFLAKNLDKGNKYEELKNMAFRLNALIDKNYVNKDIAYWEKQPLDVIDTTIKEEEGFEKIHEDEKYVALAINSHKAAKQWGKDTAWCIANDNPHYWNEHTTKNNDKFIYLLNKENPDNNVAVQIRPNGKQTFWNINDKTIAEDLVLKRFPAWEKIKITEYAQPKTKEQAAEDLIKRIVRAVKAAGGKETSDGWDVEGDVDLVGLKLTEIPIKFNIVEGNFYCMSNELTSLKGAPTYVGGAFDCTNNQIQSLAGGPTNVKGNFCCVYNLLTSLDGAPTKVGGDFDCNSNKLTSLKGAPSLVKGDFSCNRNKLTSLIGAPTSVEGDFDCSHNVLKSLDGAPKVKGKINIENNSREFAKEDTEKAFKEPIKKKVTINDSESKEVGEGRVNVQRKDTGHKVWISKETFESNKDDYEPIEANMKISQLLLRRRYQLLSGRII